MLCLLRLLCLKDQATELSFEPAMVTESTDQAEGLGSEALGLRLSYKVAGTRHELESLPTHLTTVTIQELERLPANGHSVLGLLASHANSPMRSTGKSIRFSLE